MVVKGKAASTRAEKEERGSCGRIFGMGREGGTTVEGGGGLGVVLVVVVALRFLEVVPSSRPERGGRYAVGFRRRANARGVSSLLLGRLRFLEGWVVLVVVVGVDFLTGRGCAVLVGGRS